jgi:Lon protease-like protein
MARYLPLFPMNTVLFPGATLVLRIFEPRYKAMLRECLDSDRRFGVVLIKSGDEVGGPAQPHSVGTIARIESLDAPTRSGLPLEVTGERRFKIVSLDKSKPFLAGQVEPLDDAEPAAPPSDLVRYARDAARSFVSLILAARGAYSSSLAVPGDPVALSYFMGIVATDAPLRSKQQVLEADGLALRLQAGIALLEEERGRLKRAVMRAGPGPQESRFSSN